MKTLLEQFLKRFLMGYSIAILSKLSTGISNLPILCLQNMTRLIPSNLLISVLPVNGRVNMKIQFRQVLSDTHHQSL